MLPSEPDECAQAVLIRLEVSGDLATADELHRIHRLEDDLQAVLPKDAVDGHDIGDGRAVIYVYGSDADELWASVAPVVRASGFRSGEATLRYGTVQDLDAREETRPL